MKTAAQPLSSSLEDYLEAVLDLVRTGRVARVRDIARRLNVGMPSVSVALKTLSARGLVNYDPYQVITLTKRGEKLGRDITHRHTVLQGFLADVLGVEAGVAQSNACRMEHAIDDEVLERLKDFAEFVQRCPRVGRTWGTVAARKDPAGELSPPCPAYGGGSRVAGPTGPAKATGDSRNDRGSPKDA
jgi:DtxR family Mn-dependent transcriptional regulator